jgi:hypothetical protein
MAIEELKRIFRVPLIKREKEGPPRRKKRPWKRDSERPEGEVDKKTGKVDIKV